MFSNSQSNLYLKFIILEIKSCFTCGEIKLYHNVKLFHYIISAIVQTRFKQTSKASQNETASESALQIVTHFSPTFPILYLLTTAIYQRFWLYVIIMSRTSFIVNQSTFYSCLNVKKQAPYLKFKWQQWDSNPQPVSS